MATYTPAGNVCANANALPRLKRPSELPNFIGIMAPVRTMVLFFTFSASTFAVSLMVSVPWVIQSVFLRMIALVSDQFPVFIRHFQAVNHHQCPYFNRYFAAAHFQQVCMWVSLKYNCPFSSLYSLSKVPPVMKMRIAIT